MGADGKRVTLSQVRLFVNGVQPGDPAPYAITSNAAGRLQIGRALWNKLPADYWPGAVDQVRVFPGVLTTSEISRLANPN